MELPYPRLIKLNNGSILDVNRVRLIVRGELNQYTVVIEGSDFAPHADVDDVQFITGILGLELVPQNTTASEPVIQTRLEKIDD